MILLYAAMTAAALALLAGLLSRSFGPGKTARKVRALLLVLTGVPAAFPLAGALLPNGTLGRWFQRWGNVYLGFFIYFFGTLLLLRLILFLKQLWHRRRTGEAWTPGRKGSAVVLAALLLCTVCVNLLGYRQARNVQVTGYTLPKETLSQEEPLRLVLLSDLHIGVNSSPELYRDMVSLVNAQEPDLILIAGDIVTSCFEGMDDPSAYARVLGTMQAKFGTYVVYGNHDVEEPLLGGFSCVDAERAYRHPEMETFLSDCGWELLTDEAAEIPELGGLAIVGRRDLSRPGDGVSERETIPALLENISPEAPALLLAHEPAELSALAGYGIDLCVSGHTHDGQIFPGNVFCRLFCPQSYGMRDWNGCVSIVSSGVGFYGPPIRVGTRSEIVVIDLQ